MNTLAGPAKKETQKRIKEMRNHYMYGKFIETMIQIPKAGRFVGKQLMEEVNKPFPTPKEMTGYFNGKLFKSSDRKYALGKFFRAEFGHRSLRRVILNWWLRCRQCWEDSKAIHGEGKFGFSYQTVRGHLSKAEKVEIKKQNTDRKKRVILWRNELYKMNTRRSDVGGATKSS